MRVFNTARNPFVSRRLAGGLGSVEVAEVMTAADFETPFAFVTVWRLGPGASVGLHRHQRSEECIVVLDRPLVVVRDESCAVVEPPAVALCSAGGVHGVRNDGDTPTEFIAVGVAPDDGPFDAVELGDDLGSRLPRGTHLRDLERLDRTLLADTVAHRGLGTISFRRVFDHSAFLTSWGFVDHAVVPPGASVGYHRHDTVQECYIIIAGRGWMKVDGEAAEVSVGDCIPNRIGGSHGIVNHSPDALEFLNLAVFLNKGHFDATDLDDDLSDLL